MNHGFLKELIVEHLDQTIDPNKLLKAIRKLRNEYDLDFMDTMVEEFNELIDRIKSGEFNVEAKEKVDIDIPIRSKEVDVTKLIKAVQVRMSFTSNGSMWDDIKYWEDRIKSGEFNKCTSA